MSGAGAAVGLILGGWLTGLHFDIVGLSIEGWRLTFLINTPIGIIAAAVRAAGAGRVRAHPGELDIPGAITGTVGLLGIVYGLNRAGQHGWGNTWTIVSLVVGALLLATFMLIESRVEHPLLPFRVFLNRTRASSFVAMFLAPAAMFAMFYFLSLYIQNVMGYSPLKAGLAFLPFSFGIVVAAGLASNLVNRIDARYLAGVGTLMAAGALFGFSRLPYDTAFPARRDGQLRHRHPAVHPADVVRHGHDFVPLTLTAVHHLRNEDSGIGSGVLNTMQQVGGALGSRRWHRGDAHVHRPRCRARQGRCGRAQSGDRSRTPSSGDVPADRPEPDLHRGRDHRVPGRRRPDAGRLPGRLDLPDVKHEELATDGPEVVHVG